jgi:magnesium transporter
MPAALVEDLLARLTPHERGLTRALLAHPPETAGRIMIPEFVALGAGMTAAEGLAEVRARGRGVETVHALPVVDDGGRLTGLLELSDLVLADPEARLESLLDGAPPAVRVGDDQEAVARVIRAADLLAVPVVDAGGRPVGLVTVDDAIDVLAREEAEDFARVAGATEPLRRPYFSASVFLMARGRVVWLLVLAVAATLTVSVLGAFEDAIEQVVALALFIPLLIDAGGNAGAQSSTTVVRALAVNEVRPSDLGRVVVRELGVGGLLGTTLAALAFAPVALFAGRPVALVVSLSLLVTCALAAAVGSTMPILAGRLGVDPAVVSAPLVTTVVDAAGLLVYFLLARALLGV